MRKINAEKLYQKQNSIIHRGLIAIGLPYQENKDDWIAFCRQLSQRKTIFSLTDLTLGERRQLIDHLKKQGARLYNPTIPGELTNWQKGDSPQTAVIEDASEYPGRPAMDRFPEKAPLLRKIEALLADAKRPWNYAHSMAARMCKVDRVQWCKPHQLKKIVAALTYDARRHGRL